MYNKSIIVLNTNFTTNSTKTSSLFIGITFQIQSVATDSETNNSQVLQSPLKFIVVLLDNRRRACYTFE